MSMDPDDKALLRHVANEVSSMRTQLYNTHELLKAHIIRDDEVHDQLRDKHSKEVGRLHSRVDRLSKVVYLGGGSLSATGAVALAWLKGLFGGPS